MNTSNDLVHLVVSMTRQEKRYFKLSAAFYNKGEGNDCLRLFEIIDKLQPESDTALAAAVQGKPYVRRLSSLKNELTELLLDSLSAYHATKQLRAQLRRLLTHVETLYNRGLYNHCLKVLTRAEKKARETEYHPALIEVFRWKRILLIKGVTDSFETDIDKLYQQADILLVQITNANNYLRLMDLMQSISARYASIPVPGDLEKLREIIAHPLIQDETQAVSFEAQLALYNTLGTYSLLTGDQQGALQQYKKAVYLWKRFPAMIADRPSQYARYLLNYLNCLLSSSDESEFTTILRDLKNLSASPEVTHGMEDAWNIELLYFLNRGQLEHCLSVIADIEKSLSVRADKYSPLVYITLCYNCAVIYFLKGRYSKALEYITIILNERRIELKRDIQEFARIFSVLVHYELGNTDVLDNMLRSSRRLARKNQSPGVLETIIMQSVEKLLDATDPKDISRIISIMYGELVELLHRSAQEFLGLSEILLWAESTIQNRPTHEIFAEKMQRGPYETTKDMFPLKN